ncbi:hypothetical protein [Humibacter soli]
MTLNDAQTWTIIGVLVAGFAAFLTVIMTMLNRTLAAELRAIRFEIAAVTTRVDGMGAEISSLRTEMARRLDLLDAEVANLARKVFGQH